MLKVIKWLFILLIAAIVGLAIWGYTPDRDPKDLMEKYGQSPSRILPLPNGQKVHIRDEGPRNAPVLLLLHGSNSSLHTWDGWVSKLKEKYRIVRYDQPGHGLTGPQVKNDYSAKMMSDTAAMVMEQLGIFDYTIIGNSMGGYVAWNHAVQYPNRVNGLVLVDATGAPGITAEKLPIGFRIARNEWGQKLMRYFSPRIVIDQSVKQSVANPAIISPADVDRYWELLLYPGNRQATIDRANTQYSDANPAMLKNLPMPSLILWGAKDTLIPVAAAKWFHDNLPNSALNIYRDLGHIPMEEDPDRTADTLMQWLKDLRPNQDQLTEEQCISPEAAANILPGMGDIPDAQNITICTDANAQNGDTQSNEAETDKPGEKAEKPAEKPSDENKTPAKKEPAKEEDE